MSDYWKDLAEKIDFAKVSEAHEDDQEVEGDIGESSTTIGPPIWPWDSVRSKLRFVTQVNP